MFIKLNFSYPGLSALILRVMVGVVFVYHGGQKLFGAFGGPGIKGFTGYLQSLGIPFPEINAYMAAGAEFFCGLALIAGLWVRLAAIPLIFTMIVAIATATGKNGFNIVNGGAEYNFVLIAALISMALQRSDKWCLKE
ncbi:MAG: oxidoreductase [Nitrospinaceae bacterium]|nr:MAG: oxidoreductase [Nitrospinaceae bacterium]